MKKIITISAFFICLISFGQVNVNPTVTENYVHKITYKNGYQEVQLNTAPNTDKLETINYFDGLGRPLQSISVRQGGESINNDSDIISHFEYDAYGRQAKDYLPFPSSDNDGKFKDAAVAEIESYYQAHHLADLDINSLNPYSNKVFEGSPLSRIYAQGAPGKDWFANGGGNVNPINPNHFIWFDYETNIANEVARYTVIFPTGNQEVPQLFYNGFYNASELYKTIIKDENWERNTDPNVPNLDHTTEEFKDKEGRVVLKRSYNDDLTHDTYYVYDDFGNLTYVLSPKGSDTILTTNTYTSFTQTVKAHNFVETDKYGNPIASGSGAVDVTLDKINETITLDFNLSFSPGIEVLNGPIALLDEYVPDMVIGTINQSGASYSVSIVDNFLYITGTGLVTQITDNFTINLPSYSPDSGVLDDLCYQYHYDYRNRLIEKKIPGKDWEYIIYDRLDRPVLTQDANLRTQDDWLFTKYDALGRVTYTGIYHKVFSRSAMQNTYNSQTILNESKNQNAIGIGGTLVFYTNNAFPTNDLDVLSINYYDDYVFDLAGLTLPTQNGYGISITQQTYSLPTGSKVRVLDTNDWITTVTGYDDKTRPVYVSTLNEYLDTEDTVESDLDFVGKVLQTTTSHTKGNNAAIVTIDDFTYDHAGRLVSQKQEIVGQGQERIAVNYYDELGQLEKKDVGGETVFDGYTDFVGVDYDPSTGIITKPSTGTSGWNAGIATKGKISSDGYIEFTASQNDKSLMVGLSHINTNASYNTIEFALYLYNSGYVYVYENGVFKGSFGTHQASDVFRVERTGTTITYKKNGTVIYTSLNTSSGSLLGDASFFDINAKIQDLNIQSSSLNTVLQTVDYTYNIRGWLKGINDITNIGEDLFTFKINYNTPDNINAVPLYNGNISETVWQTANDDKVGVNSRAYFYDYDALNRITEAVYDKTGGTNEDGYYNLKHVDYDKNGNIAVLRRSGVDTNNNNTYLQYMDNLTYTYDGNQLLKVAENAGHTEGFTDGVNTGDDYTYDVNGNMLTDENKGITNITYNHLNLPTIVTTSNGNISYIYDASGIKLKKIVNETGQSTVSTLYAGNFIYEDLASTETLKFFSQPEGYTEPDGGGAYNYVYQYKDHLGNIRLSYSDTNHDGAITTGELIEENNYYPFGLKHKGYNNVINGTDHPYGYTGKEEQDELGLAMIDFGARNYQPDLGRWFNIDPLADKMRNNSPYNYAFNNPLLFVDEDGLFPIIIHVRSFAPFKHFGAGLWHGDNRSFSRNPRASSRLHQITNYETDTNTSQTRAFGSMSYSRYGAFAYSEANLRDYSSGSNINTHMFGNNDAVFPAPGGIGMPVDGGPTWAIDVHTNLDIEVSELEDGNKLVSISGQVSGDTFPNAEAFVSDAEGNSIWLGTFATESGPNTGPFFTLAGDKNKPMIGINIGIETDKNGIFTGVRVGDKTISIEQWNKDSTGPMSVDEFKKNHKDLYDQLFSSTDD